MRRLILPAIGIACGTLVGWGFFPRVETLILQEEPIENWFEVSELSVGDVTDGFSPPVRFDRTIKQPFIASWTVTVRKQSGAGFAPFCTRHGRNDYRPGGVVPENTDLDWLMSIPPNLPCPEFPSGRYLVTIVWTMEIDNLPERPFRVTSNIFEVEA